MSFGRGRGRGRGSWSGGGYITPKPFELWPDVNLPEIIGLKKEDKELVKYNNRLCQYWKTSPYHLEETVAQKIEKSFDIERFADWEKPKTTSKRDSMFQFLQLQPRNFPKELVGDSKSQQRAPKRVRWTAEQDLAKLDKLEQKENKLKDQEGKGEKEKKDGDEDEDEDDDDEEKEDDEESSDGGEYDKNIDFDDDEDDFNMDDDGNDDDDAVYD
ncbi:hypothetical protein ACFE04_003828 [Oxalis oulophora]